MGQRLIHLITSDPQVQLGGAIEAARHPRQGSDAGVLSGLTELGVKISQFSDLQPAPDAVIDFSHPSGAEAAIEYCVAHRIPLVMATTGLEPETINRLKEAASEIPVVFAPNMSLAVNLAMKLVEVASKALKNESVDVEIIEKHHRYKVDSPSGTALKFGEIVAEAIGHTHHQHGRHGIVGQRPQNEIGYHAVRLGDNPGEHTILFGMLGETIEVSVAASNRDCYASGAIAAAKWVMDQPPGLYSMQEVLGF